MSGSPEEGSAQGVQIERSKDHLEGLQQFHAALAKLHLAEHELASIRVDLLARGIDLDVCDELHW